MPKTKILILTSILLIVGAAFSGDILNSDVAKAQVAQTVSDVASNGATISWPSVSGATGYKVYVAANPDDLGSSSNRKLVKSLDSSSASAQLTSLSANTDVFVRVEATGTNTYYNFYFKTLGGQGVGLSPFLVNGSSSSAVKSVHLYGPDVLMIVIEDKRVQSYSLNSDSYDGGVNELVNDTGPDWQSGSWTVTRNDGSSLAVQNIYRNSWPVGNFYDELINNGNTWGGAQNNHLLDVEHQIFLKLNSSVGSSDILTVSGPHGLSLTIPYSDKYLETPVIQLNQVGYSPRATKRYAYVSGWMGDGGGLSLSNFPSQASVLVEPSSPFTSRSAVASGISISQRSSSDTMSGTAVKEISLSSVPENDSSFYRVYIPGVGVSFRTMVSDKASLKAFYTTARGLFLNRWGRDLDCAYTDWCDRSADHPTVYLAEKASEGFFSQSTQQGATIPLVGGHHDAGDFDLRQYHYVIARQILRAYELDPSVFSDGQLNIPESGNGIPDLLDEALWSVAAWEQLQEDDGGVRSGVESYRHPFGNYFADADPLPYWTFSRNTIHTLRVAGLFAQASRLVAPFNSSRATTLRAEAIAAYDYAVAQGVSDSVGGPLFYAVSELYRLTGEQTYKDKFEQLWTDNEFYTTGMPNIRHLENWTSAYTLSTNQPIIADHVLGYLLSGNDATVLSYLDLADNQFTDKAGDEKWVIDTLYAHRNGLPSGWSTNWGKSIGQGEYLMAIYSKMQLGTATASEEQDYINAISLAADYVLGGNPMGMSWVTGLGSYSPQNPLHNDSIAFQILYNLPPMPGIPVYGPSDLNSAADYYDYGRNTFYPTKNSRPTYRKYGDLRSFVSTNEFTSWETQSNVTALFAALIDGSSVPTSWKPGQTDHKDRLPLDDSFQTAVAQGQSAPVCGNGIVESGEACDDGNSVDSDSCNNSCEENTSTTTGDTGGVVSGGGGATGGTTTTDDSSTDQTQTPTQTETGLVPQEPQPALTGTLVKGDKSPAVYLLENNKLRTFFNAKYFLANGFSWDDITTVSQSDLWQYGFEHNVVYPNGTLIKGDLPDVFMIVDGYIRKITSEDIFNGLGLQWHNIIVVSYLELGYYPEGEDIDSLDDLNSSFISDLDSDNDTLYYYLELIWGSSNTDSDSDDDGYLDGLEVKNHFSPIISAQRL